MLFMTRITVPYGSGELCADIPDSHFQSIVLPSSTETAGGSPDDIVRWALEDPIGTKRLSEIASKTSKAAIFVNDITRPTPTAYLLPFVLAELEKAGVPDENVTICFALGLHRALTEEECRKMNMKKNI